MVVRVPLWAGTSNSSSGKVTTQESDLIIRLFKSSGVVTLNMYFAPRGWICPALCISELENPESKIKSTGANTAVWTRK